MTREQINATLVRCLRSAMGFYARRWKVVRLDYSERDYALDLLCKAGDLRDLANRWQQNPV
jgi:hypothetical protein